MIELVFPADRERTLQTANEIMAGRPKPHFQNRYVCKDGRVIHHHGSVRCSQADGMRVVVARDITELKRAESTQVVLHAIAEPAGAVQQHPPDHRCCSTRSNCRNTPRS